jgi:AbrB family looped-hinge helix DNA binding protein
MDERLTLGTTVKEILSTLTSKGQVTIPAEVRRHLGIEQGDRLSFVIADDGRIEVKAPKYSDVASLAGAAGTLQEPMSWDQMREIAREDRFDAKHDV